MVASMQGGSGAGNMVKQLKNVTTQYGVKHRFVWGSKNLPIRGTPWVPILTMDFTCKVEDNWMVDPLTITEISIMRFPVTMLFPRLACSRYVDGGTVSYAHYSVLLQQLFWGKHLGLPQLAASSTSGFVQSPNQMKNYRRHRGLIAGASWSNREVE